MNIAIINETSDEIFQYLDLSDYDVNIFEECEEEYEVWGCSYCNKVFDTIKMIYFYFYNNAR